MGAAILQDYGLKISPVLDKLDEMLNWQVAGITAQMLTQGGQLEPPGTADC